MTTFSTGKPPEDGMYAAYSDLPERPDDKPSLYAYRGGVFQHYTGWYDHAITHWLKLDIPMEPEP